MLTSFNKSLTGVSGPYYKRLHRSAGLPASAKARLPPEFSRKGGQIMKLVWTGLAAVAVVAAAVLPTAPEFLGIRWG